MAGTAGQGMEGGKQVGRNTHRLRDTQIESGRQIEDGDRQTSRDGFFSF